MSSTLTIGLSEVQSDFREEGGVYTVMVTADPAITITDGASAIIELVATLVTAGTNKSFFLKVTATGSDIVYNTTPQSVGTLAYSDTITASTGNLYRV